ncbi:hypothetical protein LINPERHAP2_LOCUS25724 [Linum perenne]
MQEEAVVNPRCPIVQFSDTEISEFYKPWSKALVVRVLEKSFAYPVLKRRLETIWAKAGHIQVADMSNDFFLVRFSSADDYQRAAFNGPWKMFDYYITVARWSPEFNEDEPIGKILTWVRLPKLPIHFFNPTAVNRIGNHIGRTVRMDLATAEGARARYARVCVEVDLSKPLLGKYQIGDRVFLVEYESLENICFHCGIYGHKDDSCPSMTSNAKADNAEVPISPPEAVPEEAGDTGSWMIVTRRRPKGSSDKQKVPKGKGSSNGPAGSHQRQSSRFSVLQRESSAVVEPVSKAVASSRAVKAVPQPVEDPISQLTKIAEKMFSGSDKAASGPTRAPLGDKTNTLPLSVGTPKNKAPVVSSQLPETAGLVSVPISYDNPMFESAAVSSVGPGVIPSSRGKVASVRTKKVVQKPPISKEGKDKVRSFKPQGAPKISVAGATGLNIKAGRPPDGSC